MRFRKQAPLKVDSASWLENQVGIPDPRQSPGMDARLRLALLCLALGTVPHFRLEACVALGTGMPEMEHVRPSGGQRRGLSLDITAHFADRTVRGGQSCLSEAGDVEPFSRFQPTSPDDPAAIPADGGIDQFMLQRRQPDSDRNVSLFRIREMHRRSVLNLRLDDRWQPDLPARLLEQRGQPLDLLGRQALSVVQIRRQIELAPGQLRVLPRHLVRSISRR